MGYSVTGTVWHAVTVQARGSTGYFKFLLTMEQKTGQALSGMLNLEPGSLQMESDYISFLKMLSPLPEK